MKGLRIFGALFLFACACASASAQESRFERGRRAIGRVHVLKVSLSQDGERANLNAHRGSCVAIGPDRLLTAEHVVHNMPIVFVSIQGTAFAAKVVRTDMANDRAELQPLEPIRLEYANVSPYDDLRPGDELVGMGYVAAAEPLREVSAPIKRFDRITVSVDKRNYGRSEVVVVSQPYVSGMSGGGVFDQEGYLVGIVTSLQRAESVGILRPLRRSQLRGNN